MERIGRKPLQGVINIIWFNWHFYVLAFALITFLFFLHKFLPEGLAIILLIVALLAITGIFISLIVSWYIYDRF